MGNQQPFYEERKMELNMGWGKFPMAGKLIRFLNLIDFEHTLFGLPFAYLGAFTALPGFPGWTKLLWITVAMVGARTAALCMNRAIDVEIDRRNPRTSNWILARGDFSLPFVWGITLFSLLLLALAAWRLNPLCLKLAPLAVLILWLYSYTKRFTWWCHLILGLAIGIGPVASWIAVTGQLAWQPFLLSLAVACWVAGFDTMYACQDIEFDRREGLYSIPARFGAQGALNFARAFHTLTIMLFAFFGLAMSLGWLYFLSIAIAALILVYEHTLVKADDLKLVDRAAFRVNHYVGLVVFVLTLVDVFK
jgi:4-hydroxybenzoate polyprenyltransferase